MTSCQVLVVMDKVEREDFYINTMGFDNLDIYEDWQFVVQYERDCGEVSNDLLYSLDFQEVVDFVNKPTLYGLVGVLEYEFNHQLPFREWEDEELIQFTHFLKILLLIS